MRKKFTMLLASLFLVMGTAWAEEATTHDDGLYKIHWEWDKRGYLAYHDTDYPNSPQLAGVVNHNANGHYQLTDAGINLGWYLYTSPKTGKSYLFEATTGKFITFNPADFNIANSKQCLLSTEVTDYAMLNLLATDNASAPAFALRYVHNGTNYQFCSGCGSNKGQNPVRFATNGQDDGGIPFKFVEDKTLTITDEVKNAAIANITEHEKYFPVHIGTRTSSDRKIATVSLNSDFFNLSTPANTTLLTHQGNGLQYIDLTKSVTMKARAGETVTATITLAGGKWINGYLYIDAASDGFTASVGNDGFTPQEDLKTFTHYQGKDSHGATNDGNHFTNLAMPSFSMPTEAGTYRMRFKTDWSNIMPDGGEDVNSKQNQFVSAWGTIVDVMLEVVALEADAFILSAPAGCEVTYNGNTYTNGASFVPVGELSASDFSVPERAGYTAVVTIDNENKTVAITYDLNLQVGDKLILRNKQHNVYMGVMLEGGELDGDPAPTTKKLASTSAYNYKNCWDLVAATHNETACFYLYNPYYEWYASPISARDGAVLMSKNPAEAGCYQFEKQGDYITIKCLNGANTGYVYLHQVTNDNRKIVDWNADADASQWSFEFVSRDTEEDWVALMSTELETSKTTLQNRLGNAIGLYSGMTEDEMNALIANTVIPAEGTAVEKIKAGVAAVYHLQTKINALVLNTPQTGKYYRLQNVASNNYMSGNKNNITLLTDGANVVSTIFYLDENKALRAVNGRYLDCSAKGYSDTKRNGAFGPAYNGPTEGVITYMNNGCWAYGAGNNGAGLDKMTGGTPNQAGYNWRFIEVAAEDVTKYEEMKTISTSLSTFMTTASNDMGLIALQTTDNTAKGYLSSCGHGDSNVEVYMIDGKNNTCYASPWSSPVEGIDYHYWQVDLGEGVSLSEFVFSYVTRDNGDDTPYSLNIKGSADGTSFSSLAEITEGLPQTGGALYTSATISNPSNYRYIRFEVTDSKKGNGADPGYAAGGHATQKTFAIAEFSIARVGSSASAADQQVTTALTAAQAALDGVYSQSLTDAVSTVQNALTTLKAAHTDMRMESVEKPTYPFVVTTDVNAPALYAIKSGRTDEGKEWWYTYIDGGKIALRQYKGEENQLWFFKEVITDDYKYALQLYPAADKTKAMSYENTNSGKDKIVAQTPETAGWTNLWLLAKTNGDAPYGLQTYNRANYLSNNGGYTNNMGMHTAAPNADGGTAMYISSQADAAQQLINTAKEMANGKGATVGYYTEASVATLESAITATETNFAQGNYTMTELVSAMEGLQVILPESGRYYQIVSALSFSETKAIYSTGDALAWKSFNGTDKTFYWTIVPDGQGKYTLQNVENNKYINGLEMSQEEVTNTTLKFLALGQFNIISNGKTFHANGHNNGNGNNGGIISYGGSANSASAWKIIEVEHPDLAVAKAALQNRVTELNAIIANMGSAIGQYKDGNKTELQGHVATAQGVLDRGSKVPGDYTTALITLNGAIEGFDYSLILPEAGKYYQIKSAKPEFLEKQGVEMAMYSNASNGLLYWKALDETDLNFCWTITPNNDGTSFVFQNAGDNKYIPAIVDDQYKMTEDANSAQSFTLSFLGSRQFNITGSGTMHMKGHSNGDGKTGHICGYDGGLNTPSAWYIEEVDMSFVRDEFNELVSTARTYADKMAQGSLIHKDYDNATELSAAIDNIAGSVDANTPIVDCISKIQLLEGIIDNFDMKKVEPGFYYFVNDGKYLSDNIKGVGETQRVLTTEVSSINIFYYDGETLISYASGFGFEYGICKTGTPEKMNNFEFGMADEPGMYTVKSVAGTSEVGYADGYWKNNNGELKRVDAADASGWNIVEVTTLPVTLTPIGKNSWATLYAPVALSIPTGVTAYTGKLNNEKTSLTLIAIEEGGIIPAKTAVILQGTQGGSHNFTKTTTETTIDGNVLAGTVATKVAPTNEGTIYTLQAYSDTKPAPEGYTLPVAFMQYYDEETEKVPNLKGFRAYLPLDETVAQSISIRFEGTTDIEHSEIRNQHSEMIFDLLGRRVEAITKGGIYIVNGKKVVVK